jgi:hypothetical protein
MTATAVIAATTSASTAHTFSVAAGSSRTFKAHDMIASDKPIIFEAPNAAGTYSPITVELETGRPMRALLTSRNSTLVLNGPLDARINKPITENAVEVSEYT